jgi:hypothetical protein
MTAEDDQAKKFEGWPLVKEQGGHAATMPKGHLRYPHGQIQGRQGWHQEAQELNHSEYQTG